MAPPHTTKLCWRRLSRLLRETDEGVPRHVRQGEDAGDERQNVAAAHEHEPADERLDVLALGPAPPGLGRHEAQTRGQHQEGLDARREQVVPDVHVGPAEDERGQCRRGQRQPAQRHVVVVGDRHGRRQQLGQVHGLGRQSGGTGQSASRHRGPAGGKGRQEYGGHLGKRSHD